MAALLKHSDDDGDLSVIASGGEILIACNRGHYWIVPAAQRSVDVAVNGSLELESTRHDETAGLDAPAGPGVIDAVLLEGLTDRFGSDVREALGSD